MPKKKKQRIDSVSAAIAAAKKVNQKIKPPKHVPLDKKDKPFFESVISEFAKSEWSDHQLELAANLARMMADLTREQIELRKEGTICYSEKGTPVINPRKTAVQMYASTILAMRRSLSLHARAQGEPRDTGKRRGVIKSLETDLNDESDLLAKPVFN